jgi:hypothetical protein
MKIEEIENLQRRWHELTEKPVRADSFNAAILRGELQEKLNILHRLNGLSETDIEGVSIVNALEETNSRLRKLIAGVPLDDAAPNRAASWSARPVDPHGGSGDRAKIHPASFESSGRIRTSL